jgi:hypothetical protein
MARPFVRLFALCWWILVCGCVGKQSRIEAPRWNPSDFADAVMEKLDTNGDSGINEGELAAAPGLQFGARFIDSDSDGQLSHEELVKRFQFYVDRRIGLTNKTIQFIYKGRPLARAEVRLVPEFFLTELLETATGTTDEAGMLLADIPSNDLRTPMMRPGYYRVEIAKLPAEYNTATTVGVEVSAASDDASTYGPIVIRLDDKKRTGGKL